MKVPQNAFYSIIKNIITQNFVEKNRGLVKINWCFDVMNKIWIENFIFVPEFFQQILSSYRRSNSNNSNFSVQCGNYILIVTKRKGTFVFSCTFFLFFDLSFASTETKFINPKTKTQNNFLVNTRILVKLFQKKPK